MFVTSNGINQVSKYKVLESTCHLSTTYSFYVIYILIVLFSTFLYTFRQRNRSQKSTAPDAMTSYPPRESAKTDYAIPKPTRLNLLVPPPSSSSTPTPVPDTYISQARIIAEANPISRETQSERIKRVRKLAEDKFRIDQERIKRANRDRNDLHLGDDILDDPIIIEDLERDVVGGDHRYQDVEPNLARPQAGSGGDVRIPSRYQTTTSTYTTTTTTHTSTSTYTYRTDSRGTASVHISDISDEQLHKRISKEMAEKAERHRQRDLQKERQRKRDIEEARYKAARLAQEAREKESDAANKERKRKERHNVRGHEEAEEAPKRSRRGSTPLFNPAYGNGSGTDEDHGGIPRSGERGSDGRGEGGKRGEGSGYGREHYPTSTRSNSREREKKERERYISRWSRLLSTTTDSDSDNIIEMELSYTDIPWPIYTKSKLEKKSISLFLSNVALLPAQGGMIAGKEGKEAERKILREAIRNFHPDRFSSKVLPRVREGEREKVKEGMEICSRVLTDLIMENSKSR